MWAWRWSRRIPQNLNIPFNIYATAEGRRFKNNAVAKDLMFKAKARTTKLNIVLKDNQGPRPRKTSPLINYNYN